MSTAEPSLLRAHLQQRLRDSQPGGDPIAPLLAGLPPEQRAEALSHIPAQVAHAAVLVPIIERPSGLQVLLTVRASHLAHHPGQISFPGGRIETADADIIDAALRETEEEVGIGREFISVLGHLPDHLVMTGFRISPVVGLVRPQFSLRLDPTEVDEAFEVPLSFVLDPRNHVPRRREFGRFSFMTCDIPYQDRRIWGATAAMLLSLYDRLQEP